MSDPFQDRLLALGRNYSDMMAVASIDRCNCLIRSAPGADQMPAIRRG
jgi:hypothetical protein